MNGNNSINSMITIRSEDFSTINNTVSVSHPHITTSIQIRPAWSLKSKINISENSLYFIATCLRQHKTKYNYSYTINSTRLKKQKILLPINEKSEPDYNYMEKYISNMMIKKYKEYIEFVQSKQIVAK
jgi:hypothetical protein